MISPFSIVTVHQSDRFKIWSTLFKSLSSSDSLTKLQGNGVPCHICTPSHLFLKQLKTSSRAAFSSELTLGITVNSRCWCILGHRRNNQRKR